MAEERRERGARRMRDVCGVDAPSEGLGRFTDITVEHLFGEVWENPTLSVRDRRLVVLGILAALGERPFIFNLGHGILPQTPIAHVERMLARVRRRRE